MDKSRIEMMRGYAETDGCRRQFLLGYFGEDLPEPCGNCDTCVDGSAAPRRRRTATPLPRRCRSGAGAVPAALRAWSTSEWGPGLVMRHDDDVITVLFEQEGYKTLSRTAVLEHGLLKSAKGSSG